MVLGRTRALVGACHPAPVVAVTTVATLLSVAADATVATTVLVGLCFLSGQLTIGWSNDWVDASRDRAAGRRDKPVATGAVPESTVRAAAVAAAVSTVPLSLALGPRAGACHLVLVAAGWAYNLGLKATAWSWVPYAVAFGLLPAVVALAGSGGSWPPWWTVPAGALLGVGAHLLNAVPDLEDDRVTGVRGLPHRLGRVGSSVLAPAVLVGASALIVVGPEEGAGTGGAVVLTGVSAAATAAALGALAGRRRVALVATAVVALVDVVLLVARGDALAR